MARPFLIRRGVDGVVTTAELLLVDEGVIGRVVDTWVPILRASQEDDAKWDYPGKRRQTCYPDGLEHVAVVHGEHIEGILMTSVPGVRLPMSELPSVLYIEYLAVAPWNRLHLNNPPRFRGIGPTLIGHAARRSFDLGLDGRIGLHSEPRAVNFYEKTCKLLRRGPDLALDLEEYFEGDAAWAASFLAPRPRQP